MIEETTEPKLSLADDIRRNASTAVRSGMVMIAAGFLSFLAPLVIGRAITLFVGVMLLIGGVSECILAFKAGGGRRALPMYLKGVLMAVAGIFLTFQPVSAFGAIALILMAWFLATGLIDVVVALKLRPTDGWGWAMFSGVIALLLGIMLWLQFPLSGAWAIGVLFGIRLISSGWTLVFLGRSAKFVENSRPV